MVERRAKIMKDEARLLFLAHWILQLSIKSQAVRDWKRMNAYWKTSDQRDKNHKGHISSSTSISASDLIWQMDIYVTISFDGSVKQQKAACRRLKYWNEASRYKFLHTCTWSFRCAWIYMLSLGQILIKLAQNAGCAKNYYQAVAPRQNVGSSFDHDVWPFYELQTHRSCSVDRHESY